SAVIAVAVDSALLDSRPSQCPAGVRQRSRWATAFARARSNSCASIGTRRIVIAAPRSVARRAAFTSQQKPPVAGPAVVSNRADEWAGYLGGISLLGVAGSGAGAAGAAERAGPAAGSRSV